MLNSQTVTVTQHEESLLCTEKIYQMPIEIDYRGSHLGVDIYYSEKPSSIMNGRFGFRKFIKFGFPSEVIEPDRGLLSDRFINTVSEYFFNFFLNRKIEENADDRFAMAHTVWDNVVKIFKSKNIDYPC